MVINELFKFEKKLEIFTRIDKIGFKIVSIVLIIIVGNLGIIASIELRNPKKLMMLTKGKDMIFATIEYVAKVLK